MGINIKEIIRGFKKNKLTTLINLIGFVFSMAICLTIFLFVKNELNYDKGFKDQSMAFRVLRNVSTGDESYKTPKLAGPYFEVFKLELEGQSSSVFRVYKSDELIKYKENSFIEDNFFYVDEDFFGLWNYNFLQGNPENVLSIPNSIVISKNIAKKYFGDVSAIGEIIELQGGQKYTVNGVIDTKERPSHFEFDFIASMSIMEKLPFTKDWDAHAMNLYFVLNSAKSLDDMRSLEDRISTKYLDNQQAKTKFHFQKFGDIYFDNTAEYDQAKHGQKSIVLSFLAIGILIVVIAIANFINLSMIQYNLRLKSLGMKKILGSTSNHLMIVSIIESAITIILSLFIACGLFY